MTLLATAILASVALSFASASAVHAPTDEEAREREIAALHRRAAEVAPGTAEARGLADALSRIGRAYLSEGETGRAVELLAEAYGLDEENGLILAELTLGYVRLEDFESARFYLRRAEARATRAPPEVFGVLGDVYEALHRLEDAVAAWSEFVRFGGQDPRLLARLQRVRDELAVGRGQRSLRLEHFAVHADPSVPEELARHAGEALEAAYAEQASLLGVRLSRPQVVVLYGGRSWFSLVSVPDWVSGVYDGKIRVSVEPEDAATLLLPSVLTHELAHAMLRSSSRDRAPAWLHEGLAQWLEGRRIPRREVRGIVGSSPAETLEALDARFRMSLDRAAARSSYAQALSIVEYLIGVRGPGAITCVVAGMAEGKAFADALAAETGFSGEGLNRGWRTWAGYGGGS